MSREYTADDFNYVLPNDLIAQIPARPRDHARLLVYDRRSNQIIDDYFYNLTSYIPKDTTLVLNDSKVEKCRLKFGSHEVFVTETINPTTIRALVRPGKKFKLGKVEIAGFIFQVTDIAEDGIRTIVLDRPINDDSFDANRLTPLPPYIKQDESLEDEYQTVYAKPLGSKAAPTAGLHFTPDMLESLEKTYPIAKLTLHVGLGTFAPVKSLAIKSHKMHQEVYDITEDAAKKLNTAVHRTAVGTTSVRTLESAYHPFVKETACTSIFITPGYKFTAVDALITNFHLPKSTLLMLVAAFIGSVNEMHRIYSHAKTQKYRFYSFGDAMLIL